MLYAVLMYFSLSLILSTRNNYYSIYRNLINRTKAKKQILDYMTLCMYVFLSFFFFVFFLGGGVEGGE